MLGESLIYSLFLPLGVINGVKHSHKKKNYSPKNKMCVRRMSISAIFLLNKITAPIFQIIHIQNKTLDHCVNGCL